jgi:holliday junction DNA helicase RuvA
MIGYLRGNVHRSLGDQVVVDVGGVGYLVSVPLSVRERMPAAGAEIELHVHTVVREDVLALFGFASVEELDLFRMLIDVDGVGPRVALAILSSAHLDVLKRAIVAEDPALIRRAPGVGAKTAAKVIIELRPRLEAEAALLAVPRAQAVAANGELPAQVEAALRNLGYNPQQSRQALDGIDWKSSPSLQEALTIALKVLGR